MQNRNIKVLKLKKIHFEGGEWKEALFYIPRKPEAESRRRENAWLNS